MTFRVILLLALLGLPGAGAAQRTASDTLLDPASSGDARAQAMLGHALRRGLGVEQDFRQALVWLERSADQGHPLGIYGLGIMYGYGQGVARDSARAEALFRQAIPGLLRLAQMGDAEAQVAAGFAHRFGRGVETDARSGVEWYRRAAEQGHPVAAFTLALIYESGEEIAEDWREAVRWYARSAEASYAPGQTALGRMQYFGRGVPADTASAIGWYRRAAEQGYTEAQVRLAGALKYGRGIDRDEREAVRWYREAAEQGHVDAQVQLAGAFASGTGTDRDDAEAVRWYLRASEQGHADAQFRLGMALETGRGIDRDEREALRWYRAAAAGGHDGALDRQRRLTREAAAAPYEDRFAVVAAEHSADLRNLSVARGLPPPGFPDPTVENVLEALEGRRLVLVLYAFRGDTLEVWAMGREAVAVGSVGISPAGLDSLHQSLRGALGIEALQMARAAGRRGLGIAAARSDPASAEELVDRLSTVLFPAAVREFLAENLTAVDGLDQPGGPDLIVVPTLGIGSIPFAALRPFGSDEMLVDRAAIMIAPSLHDIARGTDPRRPSSAPALVVGNPVFPGGELSPLPGAEREAAVVAELVGTTPLLGREATKAAVLERLGAPLLYLATHGVADADDPLDGSYLAFTSADGASVARWTAREIQHTSMRSQLVVLSACQTGLGRSHDAGMIGLARAFQIAGAVQVAMSLWSVNDLATADLMEAFMHALMHGSTDPGASFARGDVASALRKAMLETRREWPNPAAWASFTIFGVHPPLQLGQSISGSG